MKDRTIDLECVGDLTEKNNFVEAIECLMDANRVRNEYIKSQHAKSDNPFKKIIYIE